jgi:hypothetical protein
MIFPFPRAEYETLSSRVIHVLNLLRFLHDTTVELKIIPHRELSLSCYPQQIPRRLVHRRSCFKWGVYVEKKRHPAQSPQLASHPRIPASQKLVDRVERWAEEDERVDQLPMRILELLLLEQPRYVASPSSLLLVADGSILGPDKLSERWKAGQST